MAKRILSVQPIYYSQNKEMCTNFLVRLSKGMLQEIAEYGPECGELKLD
jgi:hypothetical protein